MTTHDLESLLDDVLAAAEASGPDEQSYHELLSWAFQEGHINRHEYDELMRFVEGDDFDDKPPVPEFHLANEPPRPEPWRPDDVKATQRVLLAGMDCLPGQGNLFETDGEGDER